MPVLFLYKFFHKLFVQTFRFSYKLFESLFDDS